MKNEYEIGLQEYIVADGFKVQDYVIGTIGIDAEADEDYCTVFELTNLEHDSIIKFINDNNLWKKKQVFQFVGLDDWHREIVLDIDTDVKYKIVDNTLFNFTKDGEPDCPMHTATNDFLDGFYVGAGCLGNGTVYWNKREQEFGDYKIFGQITNGNELIIKTDKPELINYLKAKHK